MKKTTATKRKLSLSSPNSTPSTSGDIPKYDSVTIAGRVCTGYRPFKLESLAAVLDQLAVCKFCHSSLKLSESFGDRKGFVSKIGVSCSACGRSALISDPLSRESVLFN